MGYSLEQEIRSIWISTFFDPPRAVFDSPACRCAKLRIYMPGDLESESRMSPLAKCYVLTVMCGYWISSLDYAVLNWVKS